MLQASRSRWRRTGADRLLAIFRQHVGELVAAEPLHTFLREETHAALRILTTSNGAVQPRTVHALAELYREEASEGAFKRRADVTVLAVEPAVERAASVISLLLR